MTKMYLLSDQSSLQTFGVNDGLQSVIFCRTVLGAAKTVSQSHSQFFCTNGSKWYGWIRINGTVENLIPCGVWNKVFMLMSAKREREADAARVVGAIQEGLGGSVSCGRWINKQGCCWRRASRTQRCLETSSVVNESAVFQPRSLTHVLWLVAGEECVWTYSTHHLWTASVELRLYVLEKHRDENDVTDSEVAVCQSTL